MRGAWFVVGLAMTAALGGAAMADDGEPGAQPVLIAPTRPGRAPEPGVAYSHQGQLTISARFAVGLRTIVTYDDKNYCGSLDSTAAFGLATVCSGRAPIPLDLELGYGIAKRVDLFAELRIGLEADFASAPNLSDGPHELHLSPGARFFFSDAGHTKLFTTAQVVFDFTSYKDGPDKDRGMDFGVRNMSGLWIDLDKAYGFYVFVAETATFARWLQVELEAGVGIQARFP